MSKKNNGEFKLSWSLQEQMSYIEGWLVDNAKCVPGSLKIKSAKGDANTVELRVYNGDKVEKTNGMIYANPHTYAVGVFWVGSEKFNVSTMTAIHDLPGGKDPEANPDLKRAYADIKNDDSYAKKRERDPEQDKRLKEERDREADIQERKNFINNLPSVAVAQFAYLAAKNNADPIHHEGQLVKTVQQHPYIQRKGFEINEQDDVHILTKHNPSKEMMIKFIESASFTMPKNKWGVTKDDAIKAINDPAANFKFSNSFHQKDVSTGALIIPSRDMDGTITCLQRIAIERDERGVDKRFQANANTTGTSYIFDAKNKLADGYQPKNIIIAEGWATGRTIKDSVANDPNTMVVVAWSANQMAAVTENYLKKYQDAQIIIAADNDYKSFARMNLKDADKVHLVKNTGLMVAVDTLHKNRADSDRIGVIIPRINYKNYDPNDILCDFNDIANKYGDVAVQKAIATEIEAYTARKEVGVDESVRVVSMYNQQAQHYSNLYQLEVKSLGHDGSLIEGGIKPMALDAELTASSVQVATTDSPYAKSIDDLEALFAVSTSDVRTELDIKLENLAAISAEQAAPADAVTNKNVFVDTMTTPTNNAPSEQPIGSAADITLMLLHSSITQQFLDLGAYDTKQEMMQHIENNSSAMNNFSKVVSILMDKDMGVHVADTINKVIDSYEGASFYKDLVNIRDHSNDQFIDYTIRNTDMAKELQQTLAESQILHLSDLGVDVDKEVADKLLSSDIADQPIETKREVYKCFMDSLKSLNEDNSGWVKDVSQHIEAGLANSKVSAETEKPDQRISAAFVRGEEYSPSF